MPGELVAVAALFVQAGGAYFGLPGVEPWDAARDARRYPGPHPVVAHPPCERWGRYWSGGPSARVRQVKGDDAGCFAAALAAVERWGGVLEHPEASAAWPHFGLHLPPRGGGWVATRRGWTCCVEQGHYGHRARKATWLYAVTRDPPPLRWGRSAARVRLDEDHSAEERAAARAVGRSVAGLLRTSTVGRLTKPERAATPAPFRELLLSIARAAAATPPRAVELGAA
jgi:hypothetical protein